ncbi:YhjD/YihY/BrkB family envelope integrity protein [Arthrobacter sp. EPSL27]|uniref:YhjD/YihY/BrkB family envelope integrity protein n=1 Tax=Arthrobacter sp. EPSL27 TaxID=1745378 RepID=UPI001E2F6AD5|nr:YhjD/YihY/BrkB family envelope integrity protein [Arthrobacter sp. EPSL27]
MVQPAVNRLMRATVRSTAGRLVLRVLRDIRDLELFDRAMTLAAQAFTSILPVLIVVGSLRASLNPEADAMFAENLSLDDDTAELVKQSIPQAIGGVTFTQVFGALLLILAATAFSRALERCFRRIWKTPKASIRFAWRWVVAIVAILIGLVLVLMTRYVMRGADALSLLEFIIEVAVWSALWWFASWIVINRSVSLRALLPGSVLAGFGFAVAAVVGRLYLPRTFASSADQFGVLGLAFSYIGWLFVLMSVLLVAVTTGRVIHLTLIGQLWSRSGGAAAAPAPPGSLD